MLATCQRNCRFSLSTTLVMLGLGPLAPPRRRCHRSHGSPGQRAPHTQEAQAAPRCPDWRCHRQATVEPARRAGATSSYVENVASSPPGCSNVDVDMGHRRRRMIRVLRGGPCVFGRAAPRGLVRIAGAAQGSCSGVRDSRRTLSARHPPATRTGPERNEAISESAGRECAEPHPSHIASGPLAP